jgi:hypothetical protein
MSGKVFADRSTRNIIQRVFSEIAFSDFHLFLCFTNLPFISKSLFAKKSGEHPISSGSFR